VNMSEECARSDQQLAVTVKGSAIEGQWFNCKDSTVTNDGLTTHCWKGGSCCNTGKAADTLLY
jgi:hypothetical protein